MPIVIEPYQKQHESAVEAFNLRLRAATSDPDLVFYKRAEPAWLPQIPESSLYNRFFVALEDGVVRGAYALKYENFYVSGSEYSVACYHHPLSEGIINRSYASVGGLLLRDALRREPMLYALGMGGYDRPLPKMLRALGWTLYDVPFFFKVLHPYRFLREMEAIRKSVWKRLLMDAGAFSGTGWAAIKAVQSLKKLRLLRPDSVTAEEVKDFSGWTEPLWLEAKDDYRMTPVRDSQVLARLYPSDDTHLTKLCVKRQGGPIGWAVVGERRKDAKYGAMRVGSLVDCWAHPQDARLIVRAAVSALEQKGMDLIVTNQSHHAWGRAVEQSGFFRAGSNFIFAASRKLSALLGPLDLVLPASHVTRANGDGLPRNF
jgi:hypothetical protein